MNNKLQKMAPAWHAEAKQIISEDFEKDHAKFLDSTKRAVWWGLFFNHVKQRGKEDKSIAHGGFGPWLKSNAPQISWESVCTYMRLARDVAEKGKFQISEFLKFAHNGELPETVLKIIEGKTQQQLFLEFKQVKKNAEGDFEACPGRREGEGGREPIRTVEQQRKYVMRHVGLGIKELDKCGEDILLLEDTALEVMLSDLERRTKLIHFWLKQPLGKRNVEEARKVWKNL